MFSGFFLLFVPVIHIFPVLCVLLLAPWVHLLSKWPRACHLFSSKSNNFVQGWKFNLLANIYKLKLLEKSYTDDKGEHSDKLCTNASWDQSEPTKTSPKVPGSAQRTHLLIRIISGWHGLLWTQRWISSLPNKTEEVQNLREWTKSWKLFPSGRRTW